MSARRTFQRLAVIGAGNMGSGIAQKMASEGFEVALVDLDQDKVARGLALVRRTLDEAVERKILDADAAARVVSRIRGTTRWEDLAGVDLAVEAVFEDREVKQDVLARLERVMRDDALLATNTSSLSVTELAGSTRRPERVLGLHYFYHPAKNRLVEVIPGERTDPRALHDAWTLQERIGKTPIASADAPGFVVNRFFVPWLNEAVRLLEEGAADIPTIEDAAKRAFGVGMGPFELMNVTGIPIALHAATTLGEKLGPFYAPAQRLAQQVRAGKTWELSGEPEAARSEAVSERLRAVTFYVAAALVDEGVGTIEDTDIGARVGLRWPRGPFEMMNKVGVETAERLVADLGRRHDLAVPKTLAQRAERGESFRFTLVRSDTRDGIATLTINRPDRMNALDEAVVSQLHEAFRAAERDPAVRGIVLAGAGKAFVAGADVSFFVRNLDSGDLDRIADFTRAGHALLNDIDRSAKPVVVRLHGLALGGGLELALAADAIVASPRASVAFPETGIGIYPGLGGTQRTPRKIGQGLARWLILTGETLDAERAHAVGLVDLVVPHERLDETIAAWIRGERPAAGETKPGDLVRLERFFEREKVADMRSGSADTGDDPEIQRAVKRVGHKAPIALRIAEELLDDARELPLERGLEHELERLTEIFRTADAYEGLSSLGRRRPEFRGR